MPKEVDVISIKDADKVEVIKRMANQISNYSSNEYILGIKESVSEILEGEDYLPNITLKEFAKAARLTNPVAYKQLMEAIRNAKG